MIEKQPVNVKNLDVRNVWGKVVLYLKEKKKIALHVACGDITDVEINGSNLIVRNRDEFLVNVLEEGKKDIEQALNWQGLNLEVKIEKIQTEIPKSEQDILKLRKVVGDKLTIK